MTERLDRFMARANAAYGNARSVPPDFTTSPEISQVFGEILGLWSAVAWEQIGRPDPVLLVEAGPGRGTLMADALRAAARVAPEFRAALRLHLIEGSPRLRALQAGQLPEATWHAGLGSVPEQPLLLLANEFLDALPIRQFVRRSELWTERFVTEGRWQEYPAAERPLSPTLFREWRSGVRADDPPQPTIIERNQPAIAIAATLGTRLSAHPGAALFLDYGPEHSAPRRQPSGPARRAPRGSAHRPGSADLTAHVDFAAIAAAARAAGAAVHGPIPQGEFLTRLGLFQRTDRLARAPSPGAALR